LKLLADVTIEKPIIDELKNLEYDIKWMTEANPHLDERSGRKKGTLLRSFLLLTKAK
jgi:hypothetical protein